MNKPPKNPKQKLNLGKDWSISTWFPELVRRRFGHYQFHNWIKVDIAHDGYKNTTAVYLNGKLLVKGRKKMTLKEFREIINQE